MEWLGRSMQLAAGISKNEAENHDWDGYSNILRILLLNSNLSRAELSLLSQFENSYFSA